LLEGSLCNVPIFPLIFVGVRTCLVFAITKTIFVVPRRFEAVFIDVTVSVNDASTRLGIHAQLDSVIARQFQIVNDFGIETEKFRKSFFAAGNVDERIFWNFRTFAKLYSLVFFLSPCH